MQSLSRYLLLITLLGPLSSWALNLQITPGTLKQALNGQEPQELTLSGSGDMRDLETACSLPSLKTLDLTQLRITAYEGDGSSSRLTLFPADELPAYSLAGCKASNVLLPLWITSIGDGALLGSQIESVAIPTGVKKIGTGAFAGCSRLKIATIPSTVSQAGSGIFQNCPQLQEVSCESHLVPVAAFRGCTSLNKFLAPSLVTISDRAFAGCTALKDFTFPRSVTSLGSEAFAGSGLALVDLTQCRSLYSVGEMAFASCAALEKVLFHGGMEGVGQGAFMADTSLVTLKFTDGIREVQPLTLAGCSSLDMGPEMLSNTTETIGDYALAGLESIRTLRLPSTLTQIGSYAMSQLPSLETIDARELTAVPALGEKVWEDVEQHKVSLLVSVQTEQDFLQAEQWNEFDISQTGTPDLTPENSEARLSYRIVGNEIEVKATQEILRAILYDLSGRILAIGRGSGQAVLSLPLPQGSDPVVLLTVELATGHKASLKISLPR